MARRTPKTDAQRIEFIPLYRPFTAPIPIPTGGICDEPCSVYRISNQWRGIFLGALEVLVQQDIWDSSDPVAIQAAIDQVQEFIGMKPCSCLTQGGGSFTRNSLDILIAIENTKIFDAGGLDALAPDRPDTTFDTDTGDTGDEIVRRDVALCWACHDFVASVAEKGLLQGADIDPAIAFANLGIGFFFGRQFGVAFGAVTRAIILGVTEFMNGDDDISQVACCLYETLKGLTVSQANFKTGLDVCPDVEGLGGGFLLSLSRFALDDDDSWLAFVKDLGSYLAVTDALSTCPCERGPGCSNDFTIDNGNWTAVAGLALYDPGVGWGPPASGGLNHQIHITYTNDIDWTVSQVRFTCSNFDDEDWTWVVETWDEFEVNIEQVLIVLPQGTTSHVFNLAGATNVRRLQLSIVADEQFPRDSVKGRIVSVEILQGDCVLDIQPV